MSDNESPVSSVSNWRVRRPRSTPVERAQWRERFAQSGVSRREFAAQNDLRLQTLHGWLNEKAGSAPRQLKTAFTELQLPRAAAEPRWAAEVVRPDGWILRLAAEVPAVLLQTLLRAC